MTRRKAEGGGRKWLLGVVAVLTASPALLRAQPTDIRATVEGAPKEVALSGWVHVALVVEGPKPLRVEPPNQLLADGANGDWRVQPHGPVELTAVGGGRERWRQAYRLSPYPPLTGDPAGKRTITFAPAKVNGQPATWPPVEVEVTKSVGDPATTPPHRPVGVEEPPDPIRPPPESSVLSWVAGAAVLAVVLAVVAAWAMSRRPKPVPPHEQALAALAAADPPDAGAVECVAAILRRFVEQRFAIPATKLTTAELLAAARENGWPVEQADPLRLVLDECDRAKFAGDVPDDDRRRRLVRLAAEWLNDFGRPAGPG